MQKTISKDTPLAEISLRRYEKPSALSDRELVRKLCLTFGLLQPGDSRDVVVDILYVILKEKKEMTSEEVGSKVIELRKSRNLPLLGIASSNIRRHLKRLREVFFVEKNANNYRIMENLSLNEIMEEKIMKLMLPAIVERAKEYILAVDKEFKNKIEEIKANKNNSQALS